MNITKTDNVFDAELGFLYLEWQFCFGEDDEE